MKRALVFILLLSHMNFSMFLPQMAEVDVLDGAGRQTDDINSLFEFIDQVTLGHKDNTPEDEDDDSGQHFVIVKTVDLFSTQTVIVSTSSGNTISIVEFPEHNNIELPSAILDILSPPPKA